MDVNTLREVLQDIYNEYGELTRKRVVEVARDPGHPLHHRIEWDDRIAAECWRLEQAGELIRTARVVYKEADETGPEGTVRAFHSLPTPRGWVYEPAEVIADDPFKKRMVLNTMRREWLAMKRRYEHFAEFTEMIREAAA